MDAEQVTVTAPASALAMQRVIRRDPVAFCREVLRFNPWSKQRQILESVSSHKRTAARSALGVGKTATAARQRAREQIKHERLVEEERRKLGGDAA